MKYFKLLLLLSVFNFFNAAAQKKTTCGISKIQAFSSQHFLGNIPVDEKGNPLRPGSYMVYTLYIETKGTCSPKWKTMAKGNEKLSIATTEELTEQSNNIGTQKTSSKPVVISKTKGNRLWKIESESSDVTEDTAKNNTILLSGTCNGKTISCQAKIIIPLEIIPAQ